MTFSGKRSLYEGRALAVSREEGLHLKATRRDVLCVDSADCAPASMLRFRCFNPFYFDPDVAIPVPGQNLFACSIESVWQGLKLVDGRTDLAMFQRSPYKRPAETVRREPGYVYEDSLFLYGDHIVDLVTARYVIYLPTYLHVMEHLVPEAVLEEILTTLDQGGIVAFYDWDSNFILTDPTQSFSHSALLAAWFNGTLQEDLLAPATRWVEAKYGSGLLSLSDLPLQRYLRLSRRGERKSSL